MKSMNSMVEINLLLISILRSILEKQWLSSVFRYVLMLILTPRCWWAIFKVYQL